MPSCIRLKQAAKLMGCALLILISACTPIQTNIKPDPLIALASVVKVTNPPHLQNLGLTLDTAYLMLQKKISEGEFHIPSSLFRFYQIQDKLALKESVFFKQQSAALGLVETYWELAITDAALQKIWLEQEKLKLIPAAEGSDQNATSVTPHAHLGWLKALSFSSARLQQHRTKISQNLASMIGSKHTDLSLNYLPLSELRLRLPEPKTLLVNEFSQGLLKQHHAATYAQLTTNHPKLNPLIVNQLYQQPILGSYVWHDIETSLRHQAGLIPSNTSYPKLARQLRLTQLNISLIDYHYSQQKLHSIRGQYETAEGLYQLSQEHLLSGNVSQQEVYSLGIEAMAMHLIYLQAILDSIHAYSRVLASSHLPPDQWHQSFNSLALANNDYVAISKAINLAPASGTDKTIENSGHLVSRTGYDENPSEQSDNLNSLAFSQYLKRAPKKAIVETTAVGYLWKVDLGTQTSMTSTKTLFEQEPELTYLAYYLAPEVGANSSRLKLTAIGLGHSQAKALCRRLKVLNVECWMQQSEY